MLEGSADGVQVPYTQMVQILAVKYPIISEDAVETVAEEAVEVDGKEEGVEVGEIAEAPYIVDPSLKRLGIDKVVIPPLDDA